MSDLPYRDDDSDDPDDLYEPGAPEPGTRRRALWAFLALASSAAVIVVLMVVFLGGSGGGDGDHHPDGLAFPEHSRTPPTTTTAAAPSTPPDTPSVTSSAPPSTSAPPPARTSCPSADPCVSEGDPGKLIDAVNAYRTSHGKNALPGEASATAQKCAVHTGEGSACPSNYQWEPVASADGGDVLDKITSRGQRSWLLQSAKKVAVGWAYVPAHHNYSCAVVMVS